MEVILANTAGFCFGVERAVNTVYSQIEEHPEEQIYTYGPIIHNEEVIKDLEARGVKVIWTEEELETACQFYARIKENLGKIGGNKI